MCNSRVKILIHSISDLMSCGTACKSVSLWTCLLAYVRIRAASPAGARQVIWHRPSPGHRCIVLTWHRPLPGHRCMVLLCWDGCLMAEASLRRGKTVSYMSCSLNTQPSEPGGVATIEAPPAGNRLDGKQLGLLQPAKASTHAHQCPSPQLSWTAPHLLFQPSRWSSKWKADCRHHYAGR
jgi:hypothetical protein